MIKDNAMLRVDRLVKHYSLRTGITSRLLGQSKLYVHAVDGVSFWIEESETLSIVGESGSGKTTIGLSVLRIVEPTSGDIFFEDLSVTKLRGPEMRKLRPKMQAVFQDPSSSLDPRMRIGESVSEPLKASGIKDRSEMRKRVSEALRAVGLSETQIDLFPHQFSGGQRQRISIARAIIQKPKFIVLDEPTSSLDASVQSQILLLLEKLQEEFRLSYLLITHNMSVARYMSDRIAVMYLGKLVEIGKTGDLVDKPMHPYTQLLISSVLEPDIPANLSEVRAEGEIPSSVQPPCGCRFNTRCPYAKETCFTVEPELREIGMEHFVACHYAEEIASTLY
jgi:peptide/nickel transport system ATP-binding protein